MMTRLIPNVLTARAGALSRFGALTGALLVFGTLHAAWSLCPLFSSAPDSNPLNDWTMSDWLIDYSGGFVRRGAGGWLVGRLSLWFGLDSPTGVIAALCACALLVVWGVMLLRFRGRGWSWWLLCSPLVCGLMPYATRKDGLLFVLLAAALWLLCRRSRRALCVGSAMLLTAAAMLLHEAYFFWGVPLVLLTACGTRPGRRWPVAVCAAAFTVLFALLCLLSGDADTVRAIVNGWQSAFPAAGVEFVTDNNLGALGWPLHDTLRYHFHSNFQPGWPRWLLTLASAYYLVTQFLRVFSPNAYGRPEAVRQGAVMLLLYLTLVPMLTLLSCDMARVFQYACLGSLMLTATVPSERIDAALPSRLTAAAARLDALMTRALPPSRGLLLGMLLLLVSVPSEYDLTATFANTLYYNIVYPPFDWLCILTTAQ